MEARLYDKYVTEVVPALQQKFGYKNVNQIPKIDKIVINMGLGDCKDNPKALEVAVKELEAIAGQKAITTKAKKSIANFKLREGMNIGAKVTLRGERMYEFMDKLMNIALPRVRDFHGVSDKAFDGLAGQIKIGLKYTDKKQSVIVGLKRISKPGLRVYAQCEELPKVLGGLGIAIVSTSKGVMTDKQAREAKVGGEVLAYIW